MFGAFWRAVRPLILWEYRRGSWQYDVLAIAILLFIFLTPRGFFNGQPRLPSVQQIEALGDHPETMVFWVEPFVIEETPKDEIEQKLATLLRQRTGKNLRVTDTRPSMDSEGEIRAYLVYARP